MPGFPRILLAVTEAYRTNRTEVERVTGQLTQQMGHSGQMGQRDSLLSADILHEAYSRLAANFDYQNGGFGSAPKFPQPMTPEFLLRHYLHDGNPRTLDMVEMTLRKMAYGGMYDQLGGGFHRYSTDAFWLVPHFEKMLYDNALLSRLYLHAYQVTGKPLYSRITAEVLDYVLREMTDPSGGFYSAQDADSEGVEGKFFVWSPDEIREVLGETEGNLVGGYYGVTDHGNFEGANILNIPQDPEVFALDHGIEPAELAEVVERGKAGLLSEREKRIHPFLDDKIIASWNGLMLRALAECGATLKRPDYLDAARKNARFMADTLVQEGRLLRTYRDGQAKIAGYLEDYACVADGFLALYESTFDTEWLQRAVDLTDTMIELFWDEDVGGFFDTGTEHETLVTRPRDVFDNAQPCGGSVAAEVLLKLAIITGKEEYNLKGARPLRTLSRLMTQARAARPIGWGCWISTFRCPKRSW